MLNNIFSLLLLLVLYRPPRRNLYANTDKNQEKITNLEKRQKKVNSITTRIFYFPTFVLTRYNPWPNRGLIAPYISLPENKTAETELTVFFLFRYSETQKRVKMSGPWAKEGACYELVS